MINSNQFRELIRDTLVALDLHTKGKIPYSQAAEDLLFMTAAHESKLGHYLKQTSGPALGAFQMEPATHEDHWEYITPRAWLYDALAMMNLECDTEADALVYNLKYAIVLCRIHYYRKPEKLPDVLSKDYLGELAAYAKQHYNTPLGKASSEKYLADYLTLR